MPEPHSEGPTDRRTVKGTRVSCGPQCTVCKSWQDSGRGVWAWAGRRRGRPPCSLNGQPALSGAGPRTWPSFPQRLLPFSLIVSYFGPPGVVAPVFSFSCVLGSSRTISTASNSSQGLQRSEVTWSGRRAGRLQLLTASPLSPAAETAVQRGGEEQSHHSGSLLHGILLSASPGGRAPSRGACRPPCPRRAHVGFSFSWTSP